MEKNRKKKGKIRETVESLLIALLIAFFIRSFLVEAFKIPSGSMIPTLLVGDHIFVNKFAYGLRIPFTKIKIVSFAEPERGEAIVFIYPLDESKDFIKRVIGLPGDRLHIEGDKVLLNGVELKRQAIDPVQPFDVHSGRFSVNGGLFVGEERRLPVFPGWQEYRFYDEEIPGSDHGHTIQFDVRRFPLLDDELVVPAGHLFVMGDNRNNSSDSRDWGFVPIENVKGRALFVWLSLDVEGRRLRWERFGKWID